MELALFQVEQPKKGNKTDGVDGVGVEGVKTVEGGEEWASEGLN